MKKQAVNKFNEGLITDMNPLTAPPTVLTDAQNVDFVTTSDNQVILQKRMGNDPVLYEDTPVTLTEGYIPLAIKEFNDIAYIISVHKDNGKGEIGTYPSPDWDMLKFKEESPIPNLTVDISKEYFPGDEFHGIEFELSDDIVLTDPIALRDCKFYTYVLSNTGIYEDTYTIETDDARFEIVEPSGGTDITLSPGQTSNIKIKLNTKVSMQVLSFTLKATSQLSGGVLFKETRLRFIEVEELRTGVEQYDYWYDISWSEPGEDWGCNCNTDSKAPAPGHDGKLIFEYYAESSYFETPGDKGRYFWLDWIEELGATGQHFMSIVEEETTACAYTEGRTLFLEGSGRVTVLFQVEFPSNAPATNTFQMRLISNKHGNPDGLVDAGNDLGTWNSDCLGQNGCTGFVSAYAMTQENTPGQYGWYYGVH